MNIVLERFKMRFLPTIALLLILHSFGFSNQLCAEQNQLPNILFILIDDMGWSDLECYGSEFHETPNIDRLAAEGIRFTDFYAAGAVCSPTRAAIQSGQNQARLGITDFIPGHRRPYASLIVPNVSDHLPSEIVTPAEALKRQGYRTGYFGKWHLGNAEQGPDQQGYDVSIVTSGGHFGDKFRTIPPMEVPKETYLADFLTDQTIAFIQENRQKPFFAFLSHYAVHIPLHAKEKLIQKYREKPKPETGVNNPIYAAMVEHVDHSVERLMTALDEQGLTENTLVIFTSDNGGLYQSESRKGDIVCSNAPLRDEKGTLYEGGIRVPLIVRWKGTIQDGAICDEPTISTDFWPTLAAVAKVDDFEHQEIDGKNLLPLFHDPNASLDREAIYFHFPHYHHDRPAGAIRKGDWKLIEFFEDGRQELYNLKLDISEEKNLLAKRPSESNLELASTMQRQLANWRKNVNAWMPTPNPDYDPKRELDIVRKRRR